MNRWMGVLVLLSVSGCGQTIGDCFCAPGDLSLGQPSQLGPVPRGCGRVDQVWLSNATLRTFPDLSIVSVTSSNPAITIESPSGVIAGFAATTFSMNVPLTVTTSAPLDAPASLETDVEVVTDTGSPRTISFHLSVPVVAPDSFPLPPLDFGGIPVGTTASLPWSLQSMSVPEKRKGVSSVTGAGFDYATVTSPQDFEVRFAPTTAGHFQGSAALDVFTHCPQLEQLPLIGDGVAAILTATPNVIDFGDVALETPVTRTIAVDNAALQQLNLTPNFLVGDFSSNLGATPIAAGSRDAQGQLVPGRTMIEVTFKPSQRGAQAQRIQGIATTFAGSATLNLDVRGVGL